jgi:hypothetical protein
LSKIIPIYIALLLFWKFDYIITAYELVKYCNKKTIEGTENPDRDKQFEHINEKCKTFQGEHQPVISVDSKKKELIGNFKNAGRELRPKKDPILVNVYDFKDKEPGKVNPY